MAGGDREGLKRSKNFKQSEVDILLLLIDEFKSTLECKKNDKASLKKKDAAWNEIQKRFNEISCEYFRDSKTLRLKYENFKKISKKKWMEDKDYLLGTSEGLSVTPSIITEGDIKIKDIFGNVQINGYAANLASKAQQLKTQKSPELEDSLNVCSIDKIPIVVEEDIPNIDELGVTYLPEHTDVDKGTTQDDDGTTEMQDTPEDLEMTMNNNMGSGSKATIKNPRSKLSFLKVIKTKKTLDTSPTEKKIECLTEAKKELVELQRKIFKEQLEFQRIEHGARMKCMQEEHEKKMNLINLQTKNEMFTFKLKFHNLSNE